jgi:hypothetical protein
MTIHQPYDDLCAMKDNLEDEGSRHKLQARLNATVNHRFQPSPGSEKMLLHKQILKFIGKFMACTVFCDKFY